MIENIIRELDSHIADYEYQINDMLSKAEAYKKEMKRLIKARNLLLGNEADDTEPVFSYDQLDITTTINDGTTTGKMILEFLRTNGPSKSDVILKHFHPNIKRIERKTSIARISAQLAYLLKKNLITSEYTNLSARLKEYKINDKPTTNT